MPPTCTRRRNAAARWRQRQHRCSHAKGGRSEGFKRVLLSVLVRAVQAQLIATACLHLAAKMEENPKSIRDVVSQGFRV